MALIAIHHEGLFTAMHHHLNARDERQLLSLTAGQATDLKHVVGANSDAVFLTFAFIRVDNRQDVTRGLFALL